MPQPYPPHRPPWWPETEPWPPRNWRNARWGFFRRVGLLLGLLFLLTVGGCTLAFWLVAWQAGFIDVPWMHGRPMPMMRGFGWWWLGPAVFGLGLFGAGLLLLALRRTTAPVGDVMEAAERVAAGDYAVRVAERGPGEVRALARSFNAMTERLQANDEQRRRLLADVTHELRTPLTVVQGNLEAMLDGVHPRDDAHLTPVLEETRVLSRLIDDLRTLSLAESGVLKLQREPTDLGVLLTEAVNAFRPQAQAAAITLQTELADELPLLDVDPTRLREVLSNLIANALRYTPAGGTVTVKAGQVPNLAYEIAVRDTGSGIAPEALPHIFDRFYKSDDSRGSGLGLAIARSLALAHGGAIAAESERGKGTTIRFTLPAPPRTP
jgi:signal transduction histidine kinase